MIKVSRISLSINKNIPISFWPISLYPQKKPSSASTSFIKLQYIKEFDPNVYIFVIIYKFCFYHESKNCKNIFFYQKLIYLGENTSIYCSQIIVVHVHANFFTKLSPSVSQYCKRHKIRKKLKMTDRQAADCSKAVLGRKVKCARCMNCSYNKMAKVIRLLDKNVIFVYSGFFLYK